LRLIHYAAWIARRWDDPAFPQLSWFNTQRYWQDRILDCATDRADDELRCGNSRSVVSLEYPA